MNEIIQYIIRFLAGDHVPEATWKTIGYTSDEKEYSNYNLIIKPSGFFDEACYGSEESLPTLPLKQWEEVPILFGDNITETIGNIVVIHADIIAGTYFLISRYEEMVRRKTRDAHNRFPGKESLPYKAGFIDRPIIEEWGVLLRSKLRETGVEISEPPKEIKKVYLTHDVDQIAHYRNIRGMLGGILRGIKRPKEAKQAIKSYFGGLIFDPWYTFPYLFKLDLELQKKLGGDSCEIITFLRSHSGKRKEDKPLVNLLHPDYQTLIKYLKRKKVSIGLHISYEAGCNPELITEEKKRLEKFIRMKIHYNRNHFLNNREPEDFEYLINNEIADDFSMGYADMAGFRLGTCKAVQWINPAKKELTNLRLHHLTIMDITLSDKRYMFMNAHDAFQYCESLINTVRKFNGEISLLWHNNSAEKHVNSYHRILYKNLLKSFKHNNSADE
ncbi:MAG: polysaccharide deacetylase family protein [Paludibacter sp.]|nr:polysaccharide deacetylase family protein [Paludibacter sp.]MDD4199199.1 polysaccharide deacetylase family protein [Paludibacter sp.]MDD4426843.1 polysaccharide deacetylase family protein [Paludibacter sp.]